jgi:hypothetical protein
MTCANCDCENCPDDCNCENCTCGRKEESLMPQDDFGYKGKKKERPHIPRLDEYQYIG